MTKQEFLQLKSDAQEEFLAKGGFVDSTNNLKEKVDVSTAIETSIPPCATEVVMSTSTPSPSYPSHPPFDLNSQFDGFNIKDPVELLFLLDENVQNGTVTLHDWQIQAMMDFAESGVTDKAPYQAIIQACNGSGKDKYIIAPCIVWLCMRFKLAIGVVTSSSGGQLDNQTCRYIKSLAESANKKFGFEFWSCKYRHYICDFGGGSISEVFCYATDEAGKAEGYHPTVFGAKMALMVSEDKSVEDDINTALNKCTGYTHRVHVSTPGLPRGHFFDYSNIAIDRKEISSLKELKPIDWVRYKVRAKDCSHLSQYHIEQMKRDLPGGENGAAYKSQVEAEFGTTDEMVVIPSIFTWRAINKPPIHVPEPFNTAGLDLSDGGAETVLIVRNGNKVLAVIPFKFHDTQDTIKFLVEKFKLWNLNHPDSLIYGDATGIGKPILDSLKARGWKNVRYIDSRSAARRPKVYKNRATELFFNMRTLMEKTAISLPFDSQLSKQLNERYYKINPGNVHQLLSKIEQRSRGYPSPDRADALNLCFWNYETPFVEESSDEIPFEDKEEDEEIVSEFTLKSFSRGQNTKWKANDGIPANRFSELEEAVNNYNLAIKRN